MKIKLKLFLVLLMSFVVGTVSVEAVSIEKEFTVNQWATNLYYTDSGVLAGTRKSSFPPEQFLITKEEPNWSSLTDEELRDKPLSWVLKHSNYTYWGYSIIYQDQTTEFFNESSFTYDSLCSLELERGKEIRQIDIMYGDTGSVTIDYNLIKPDGSKELLKSDYSYGLFSANLPGKVELIGQSTNLDPMIENYIIVSQDEEAPFYYEENKDKVINIDLRNPQYTIHFTDELGNKIRESEKTSAKVGEMFEYRAPKIEGYSVKVNDTISELYLKEDKEFTIIYKKLADPVEEGKVIVKYEDNLGNTKSDSTILTGKVGESYQTTEKAIEGYTLIDVIGESEGIYNESDQEVTYVYEKLEIPIGEGKVIVNYKDDSGNVISETTILTGKVGESYQTTEKAIEGYTLIDVIGESEGIYNESDQEVTYVYEKKEIPSEEGRVVVNYKDDLGNMISESTILTGKVGESYQITEKEIEGYRLVDMIGESEGVYSQSDQEVTYVYEKKEIPFEEGRVIVNYKDDSGNDISDSTTLTGKVGESYQTTEKVIEGYTLVDVVGDSEGVYSQSDQEVTYVYEKLEIPIGEGKVIVNYKDDLGNVISDSTILTGKVGESYQTTEKAIEGYNLVDIIGEAEGVYSQSPKEIIYVYQKITEKNTEKENVSFEKNTPKEQINFSKLPKTGETYLQNSMKSILGLTILGGVVFLFNKKR